MLKKHLNNKNLNTNKLGIGHIYGFRIIPIYRVYMILSYINHTHTHIPKKKKKKVDSESDKRLLFWKIVSILCMVPDTQ